ncbi:DUF2254 domain-containing protein [Frigoriglobus tundricola]|uniref:DUF2254 domain-containing protein n=1 Tax=Frigoriglobus tundricola TaxID=2774151 RepID=A0A6M5Z2H8_9BACT|nr:DUF2254 domain-containing protein [Frigoriglobus tundricola]QJX00608.1 hypothetical protein FTUN_8240 [Frigoriglobus tundricola]
MRRLVALHHLLFRFRGGFLVRPVLIALGLGAFGAVLSAVEEAVPAVGRLVPRVLFPSSSDPQVAQVILACVATSTMTIVSIVFAILLMTLTLASMQFSPRIIVSFIQDRVTQQTLGMFLGTFAYCLAALPATRSLPYPFVPVATVFGAMILALASVGWLLFFIHHVSQAISVNHIVDRIAWETEAVIDEMMPSPRRAGSREEEPVPAEAPGVPVLNRASGYIRYVDTDRLVALATATGRSIRVLRRVGHFVPAGVPLVLVSGPHPAARTGDDVLAAFEFGPSRTMEQDVEFGVLQIIDIALRAVSPAVNDPSTAISCVDQLSRILIRFASRELPPPVLRGRASAASVSVLWPDFLRLVDVAFEQIRLFSKADLAVNLRMMRALTDIVSTLPDAGWRRALAARGRRIVAGCEPRFEEHELVELRERLASLERAAAEFR